MIIVAASGMATGGRVLHHLMAFAPDPRNAIVLCGFQAGGTRGAALAAGDKAGADLWPAGHVGAEVVQLAAAPRMPMREISPGCAPRPPAARGVRHPW